MLIHDLFETRLERIFTPFGGSGKNHNQQSALSRLQVKKSFSKVYIWNGNGTIRSKRQTSFACTPVATHTLFSPDTAFDRLLKMCLLNANETQKITYTTVIKTCMKYNCFMCRNFFYDNNFNCSMGSSLSSCISVVAKNNDLVDIEFAIYTIFNHS